jgi:hypothetical protein
MNTYTPTNPRHQLAKVLFDALAAGSGLGQENALVKELVQKADEKRSYEDAVSDPWGSVSGGLRSGS